MLNFRNTTYGCIALLLIAILLWKEYQLYYPFLVVLLLYIGTLSWGAFDLRLNFFMHSTCDRKTSTNQIAITFDDGPSPYTLEILGLLDQYGVKASFFLYRLAGTQISRNSKTNCYAGTCYRQP